MARYKSFKKEVEQKISKVAIPQALRLIGAMVQSEASQIARDKGVFNTGLLVQSMGHEIYETDKQRVRAGNTVDYAAANELGDSRHKARPFLAPAVYENKSDIKQIAIDVFREVMK